MDLAELFGQDLQTKNFKVDVLALSQGRSGQRISQSSPSSVRSSGVEGLGFRVHQYRAQEKIASYLVSKERRTGAGGGATASSSGLGGTDELRAGALRGSWFTAESLGVRPLPHPYTHPQRSHSRLIEEAYLRTCFRLKWPGDRQPPTLNCQPFREKEGC